MNPTSIPTDDTPYIILTGDLIGHSDARQLLQSVNERLLDNSLNRAISLSEVCYINSTGIGALVSLPTKFRRRGAETVLINPADSPRNMLDIVKIINILAVAANQVTAHQQLQVAAS